MRAQPKASHFVNGAHIDDRVGVAIPVIYTHDGSVIVTVHFDTPAMVDAPLSSAAAAPGARDWMRPVERFRVLRRAVDRVIGQLGAGTCWINGYNLNSVKARFGDVKASGVGRENAPAAVVHYTQVKSVRVGMGKVEAPW